MLMFFFYYRLLGSGCLNRESPEKISSSDCTGPLEVNCFVDTTHCVILNNDNSHSFTWQEFTKNKRKCYK